jgi:hypothetical protein
VERYGTYAHAECSALYVRIKMHRERDSARRAWEFQEVTTATIGCEAGLKWVTSVVSDVPHAPVLLPVPGRSRASLLPRPLARSQRL